MADIRTKEELIEMREAYHEKVKAYREDLIDMAISAPGARYILERLQAQADRGHRGTILDMGTGFSTLFLADWCKKSGWSYLGVEHNKAWMDFLRYTFSLSLSPKFLLMYRPVWEVKRRKARAGGVTGPFEAILVDHGPELDTRAEDTPMLSKMLAKGGIMLFDDWRPKHEGRIRRALAKAEGDWTIDSGGDAVRRFETDKSIGWAMRTKELPSLEPEPEPEPEPDLGDGVLISMYEIPIIEVDPVAEEEVEKIVREASKTPSVPDPMIFQPGELKKKSKKETM